MNGSIEVKGRVLYASQEPWVFSGTLRENILFGQPYQWEWYNTVVEACTLDKVGGSKGGDGRKGEGGGEGRMRKWMGGDRGEIKIWRWRGERTEDRGDFRIRKIT